MRWDTPLTLVSAPPGYGKTTLVSSWLSETNIPHAWLSLDEGDNDPTRFLEYFLTALHQVVPAIRLEMMDLLKGSQGGSFQTLMAVLINEAAGAGDFFIVLDDFHVLRSAPILDMLGYLLEHLPPVVHIMLLSRTDPTLPVSRLRARSHLLEIRAEQLRFSTDEIARFFDQVMRLALDAADVLALETRTEGWIAGLQLAGLAIRNVSGPSGSSMQAEDAHGFITAFTGSHAYIMDYLTEEVLRSQPEATCALFAANSHPRPDVRIVMRGRDRKRCGGGHRWAGDVGIRRAQSSLRHPARYRPALVSLPSPFQRGAGPAPGGCCILG